MDEDIEELREKKRKELEESEDGEARLDKEREKVKQKASKYLSSDARSRIGNLRAAKPELAQRIEMQIARLGEMGRIDELGDGELKEILRDAQSSDKDTDIKFRR